MDLSDVLEHSEQLKIVNTLGRLTASDRITWRPDGSDVSVTELANHSYRLFSVDADGEAPYGLTVSRREKVGPTVSYKPVAEIVMHPASDPKANAEINASLRDLYEDAYRKSRRDALKIDEFLEELDGVERGDLPPF